MKPIMEKSDSIQEIYNFEELGKEIHKDYLMDFALNYLSNHTFINAYNLAKTFLFEKYGFYKNMKKDKYTENF